MSLSNIHHLTNHTVELATDREYPFQYFMKRTLDVILATLLFVALSPIMGLIALAIKLDSTGPVFFIQERVGARRLSKKGRTVWGIRTFPLFKFRSMVQDADPSVHMAYIKAFIDGQVGASEDASSNFKLTKDDRVTRVGRFLRETSLDELPQLLNVLRGEMSLVGPRPVPIYEVEGYQARHFERLAALPGITGLWQVRGRCQVPFEDMVQLDIDYIHKQSLWLDLKLLLLTIPTVLSRRGAA
jgi:lipopolysaccharide/colanic/teichoic acid biosynthesis glycosyltransferase